MISCTVYENVIERISEERDRLKASNREMLAALVVLWEWQKTCQELMPDGMAEIVRGVIDKAEGREP